MQPLSGVELNRLNPPEYLGAALGEVLAHVHSMR